jgi:excisionase family DNA binding protein
MFGHAFFIFITSNFAEIFNLKKIMEVITIENKAYQELILKLNQLCAHFEATNSAEKDVWLNSKAVCERLDISTRTLHRMIKGRLIGFSVLRGRYRFKQSDVEKILHERHTVSCPQTFEELRQSYQINNYEKQRI